MKLNIRKLQGGGHLVTFNPLPMLPQSQPAPQAVSADEKVIKDDLLDKMLGEGITSDVMVYASQLDNAYSRYNSLPESIKNSPEGQILRRQMKGDWARLNAIKRSKEEFDKVLNDRKDALPELAIYQGKVIVQDLESGDIQGMSISDYASQMQQENKSFRAITNSQLAYLREHDNRFAGRDDLTEILHNSKSTDEVVKEIRGVLQNLGSFTKAESNATLEQQQVGEGANQLLSVKTVEGGMIKSNRENIKLAANTMWANLSPNSKDLLRAKAAQYGYPPDKIEKAAMGLAVSLLDPAIEEITKRSEGESPSGSGAAGEKMTGEQGIYQAAARLDLPMENKQLNLGGGKSIMMKAYRIDNLPKQNGDWRKEEFLSEIPEINSIATLSEGIYMGDQFIAPEKYQALLWNGHESYVMFLPTKWDEKNNRFMPNITAAKDLEEADKEVAKLPKNSPKELRKEIYYKKGFTELDEGGYPIVGRQLKPFLVLNGKIPDSLVNDPHTSTLIKTSSDADRAYKDKYTRDDKGKYINKMGYSGRLDATVDVLEGPTYIPMKLGGPLIAQYLEQKKVKVPEKQNWSMSYDRVGWFNKQDPDMGTVTQIKNGSFDSLNQ